MAFVNYKGRLLHITQRVSKTTEVLRGRKYAGSSRQIQRALESQAGFRKLSVVHISSDLSIPERTGAACPVPAACGWYFGVPVGEEQIQ